LSARPFVAAATKAGYIVDAIDAFADSQTVSLAKTTMVVAYDQNGFDAESLLAAISKLDVNQYLGFIYGSGFEAQPKLLKKIADIIPLIGNSPATVEAVKTATEFFSALDLYNIPYPFTGKQLPIAEPSTEFFLQKFSGGSGGAHIKIASNNDVLSTNHYYQQHVIGRSISLLFIANGLEVKVLGFNEQWLSPAPTLPFRYGGAVSHADLPLLVKQQMIRAALVLTKEFGLLGLNSLDAIVRDDIAYILEINPRLSATFDLYSDDLYQLPDAKMCANLNIMHLHIYASEGEAFQLTDIEKPIHIVKQSKAHAVIYASKDSEMPAGIEWPNWVVDTPYIEEINRAGQDKLITVLMDEPVCSVLACANDAISAKMIVNARVKSIKHILKL
jgi:uncharacterized protein